MTINTKKPTLNIKWLPALGSCVWTAGHAAWAHELLWLISMPDCSLPWRCDTHCCDCFHTHYTPLVGFVGGLQECHGNHSCTAAVCWNAWMNQINVSPKLAALGRRLRPGHAGKLQLHWRHNIANFYYSLFSLNVSPSSLLQSICSMWGRTCYNACSVFSSRPYSLLTPRSLLLSDKTS